MAHSDGKLSISHSVEVLIDADPPKAVRRIGGYLIHRSIRRGEGYFRGLVKQRSCQGGGVQVGELVRIL